MKLQILLVLSLAAYVRSQQEAVPRHIGNSRLGSAAFIEAYIDQGDETSYIGDR